MVTSNQSDDEGLLTVHVIGAGTGESIILQMPHETEPGLFRWGVVDCYCRAKDPSKNLTLRFLRSKRASGACHLDFLCLTHTHADHLLGMAHLLESPQIEVRRFWRHAGLGDKTLKAYKMLSKAKRENVDVRDMAHEIERILKETRPHRESCDQSKYKLLSGYNHDVYGSELHWIEDGRPVSLRVSSLAPSGSNLSDYEAELSRCIEELKSERIYEFDLGRFGAIHNSVSVVLLVTFGDTKIILGGDAEEPEWHQIFEDSDRKRQGARLNCSVIKISHHGSEGAFHENSWTEHRSAGDPVGLITPFRQLEDPLPRKDMIDRFLGLTSRLEVTCGFSGSAIAAERFESTWWRRRGAMKEIVHHAEVEGTVGRSVSVNHKGEVVGGVRSIQFD